jgi:predicted MFS family arabinose efflux permease
LISAVSWRLIFFINLPVAAGVILLSSRHVPESRDPTVTGRLDLAGAATVTAGLVGVVYGLIEGPVLGWSSPVTLTALLAGAALLVAFWMLERHIARPMVPPDALASAQFTAANIVTFVVYGGLGGALFLLPVELQEVVHYSPVAAGASLLPVTFLMLLLSSRSGALAARIGPRIQMSFGPLMVGAALVLLGRASYSGGYAVQVLPAVALLGLGLAITVAPLTATVLAAAPPEHTGVASAINNDVARTASLIAVAVLPVAAGITGSSYLHPSALASGFRTAVLVAGAACAAGGVLAWVTIRNPALPVRRERHDSHCALDAPPLCPAVSAADGGPDTVRTGPV